MSKNHYSTEQIEKRVQEILEQYPEDVEVDFDNIDTLLRDLLGDDFANNPGIKASSIEVLKYFAAPNTFSYDETTNLDLGPQAMMGTGDQKSKLDWLKKRVPKALLAVLFAAAAAGGSITIKNAADAMGMKNEAGQTMIASEYVLLMNGIKTYVLKDKEDKPTSKEEDKR